MLESRSRRRADHPPVSNRADLVDANARAQTLGDRVVSHQGSATDPITPAVIPRPHEASLLVVGGEGSDRLTRWVNLPHA